MSKEHVWPQWITRLLPGDTAREMVTLHFSTHERHVRSVPQRLFQLTVKDVCKPCNEGWMSRLEAAVKPIISGMLLGRGRVLHARGQTTLATWALLKMLVVQRTSASKDLMPPDHYRELYMLRDEQHPPPLARVYTARAGWSQDRADFAFYRLNAVQLRTTPPPQPDQIDGYLATFSVLDLVVQIFRPFAEEGEWLHRPDLASSVAQLWPPLSSFTWPPGPALTQAGVQAISGPAAGSAPTAG
jgi:hypothetical protein